MIKEAYVSFEVAKLLKEKGFEQNNPYVEMYYRLSGDMSAVTGDEMYNIDSMYAAPTHQMARAWLRECWKDKEGCIDGFCIEPYAAAYRYGFTISRVPTGSHVCNEDDVYPNEEFESYEDAVEAALKYALKNLI